MIPNASVAAAHAQLRGSARFGWWASLGTGMITLITFGMAIATPPLSGPLCKEGCFEYPYLEIASRFPRDYLWMYPAVAASLFHVAFMLSLQTRARPERQLIAQLAVVLGSMGALTLISDYVLQLTVIQPSVLAREADGVAMLSMYNPHGVFIALEELGYVLMSAALGCMALALPGHDRLERWVRRVAVGGFVLCLLALTWFLTQYGHSRSYLLELAVITTVWLVFIPCALMMAAVFRRQLRAI